MYFHFKLAREAVLVENTTRMDRDEANKNVEDAETLKKLAEGVLVRKVMEEGTNGKEAGKLAERVAVRKVVELVLKNLEEVVTQKERTRKTVEVDTFGKVQEEVVAKKAIEVDPVRDLEQKVALRKMVDLELIKLAEESRKAKLPIQEDLDMTRKTTSQLEEDVARNMAGQDLPREVTETDVAKQQETEVLLGKIVEDRLDKKVAVNIYEKEKEAGIPNKETEMDADDLGRKQRLKSSQAWIIKLLKQDRHRMVGADDEEAVMPSQKRNSLVVRKFVRQIRKRFSNLQRVFRK